MEETGSRLSMHSMGHLGKGRVGAKACIAEGLPAGGYCLYGPSMLTARSMSV